MGKDVNLWNNEYNPFNKWKVLAWYDRMKRIKTGDFAPPVNIALDICQGTQAKKLCAGYNCNFCMSNLEDEGEAARLPFDILKAIPEFYSKWGVTSICLAGHHSDPLMYKSSQLVEFLRLCNNWNVEVGFVANGLLYNDLTIEEVTRTCNWSGWSINCGKSDTHEKITGMKPGTFEKVINNMAKMYEYIKTRNIAHDIGYKFLITDDNYEEIVDAVVLAKKAGARHFQIRPTELPVERSKKIDVKIVEDQIKECLDKYEEPGVFEIFGIREKFNTDFTKKPPKRCIASPLGSTWKADGDIVICPDRRWTAHKSGMILGNFIKEGLEAIRRKWGGTEHIQMIQNANKDMENCIRCTSYHWHEMYENIVENDNMDVTLI